MRCPVLLTSSGQRRESMKLVGRCHKEKHRLARQHAARPHPPISGRATPIPGHAGPQAPTTPRCTMLLGASASMDGPLSRNPPCHVVVPCALRIGDGSRPAFLCAGRLSVQRAVGNKPEDGRRRFRNHAPQEGIMFNGLRCHVALHGVLELALATRGFRPGRRRKREGT